MPGHHRSSQRKTFDALYAFLKVKADFQKTNPAVNGFRYFGGEDLVLQHGSEFIPRPLPKGHGLVAYPQTCFINAYRAAVSKASPWIYVEGYGLSRLDRTGILHAWLTRADTPGVAFDPTWKPVEDHGVVYIGIPFRKEYIVKAHRRSKMCGVIDAWEDRWPLLTGRDAIEDVIVSLTV